MNNSLSPAMQALLKKAIDNDCLLATITFEDFNPVFIIKAISHYGPYGVSDSNTYVFLVQDLHPRKFKYIPDANHEFLHFSPDKITDSFSVPPDTLATWALNLWEERKKFQNLLEFLKLMIEPVLNTNLTVYPYKLISSTEIEITSGASTILNGRKGRLRLVPSEAEKVTIEIEL